MNLKKNIEDAKIDLVKELGIDQLPKEQQEERLLQMGEVLQQRIIIRIVEEFPEEKKDELLAVFEAKDKKPEEINKFIEDNLPNAEELILDEIGAYKRESVDFVNEVLSGGESADKRPESNKQ